MCRLLGIVSTRRAALSELLGEDLDAFLRLACVHNDGWGLAYTDATDAVAQMKEPVGAETSTRFRPLVDCSITDAAILHLRLASPDMAVQERNTHPFGDSLLAFAHNGAFSPKEVLDGQIGPDRLAALAGDTDSERFYQAVRRRVDEGEEPGKALARTAADIHARADEFVSLNSLMLTREALYAYCDHDPASEVIGRRGPDFFDLRYRAEADQVVVSSTGWPQPEADWTRLESRSVLRISRRDLSISIYQG